MFTMFFLGSLSSLMWGKCAKYEINIKNVFNLSIFLQLVLHKRVALMMKLLHESPCSMNDAAPTLSLMNWFNKPRLFSDFEPLLHIKASGHLKWILSKMLMMSDCEQLENILFVFHL